MDSIPIDLLLDIHSRLPAKSIAMSRCVSKLWSSMLRRQDFTELFLTSSSARPRLLLVVEREGVWQFFSFLQSQNQYDKLSSLVITPDSHVEFPRDNMSICCSSCIQFSCGYVSGLFYFSGMLISKKAKDTEVPVVCNPNTGQFLTLPKLLGYKKSRSFLGFDPIDKQYKVLLMAYPDCSEDGDHRILTLGSGKMKWRKIKCSLTHTPMIEGLCINGVLYYMGDYLGEYVHHTTTVIVCFDVRSEKFEFIYVNDEGFHFDNWYGALINYKGKLCLIYWKYDKSYGIEFMVLKNVEEEHEWSKYVYTFAEDDGTIDLGDVYVVGVTATGDIVLSKECYNTSEPLYVYYFNPERNTFQSVEINCFRGKDDNEAYENQSVYMFLDHVEDLNVNDAKLLKSSIFTPSVKKNKSGLNIITKSPKQNIRKKKKEKKP